MKWCHVCWPRLTAKRVEPVVSISWASCQLYEVQTVDTIFVPFSVTPGQHLPDIEIPYWFGDAVSKYHQRIFDLRFTDLSPCLMCVHTVSCECMVKLRTTSRLVQMFCASQKVLRATLRKTLLSPKIWTIWRSYKYSSIRRTEWWHVVVSLGHNCLNCSMSVWQNFTGDT